MFLPEMERRPYDFYSKLLSLYQEALPERTV